MQYDAVIVETGDKYVGTITLNRPDSLNTFNTVMADELLAALDQMENDKNVRVILIKGAGRAFCAGIDVNELAGKSAMEYRDWIERMENPLMAISRMKKPVIAQVHGLAVANGMGLVAASDLAIASEEVRMGLTAINVGLNCVGPVIPVAKCVGRKKALELLLYGDLIDSAESLKLGLLNKVVAKDELEAKARQWAEELAQKSPIGVQIAKSAFYKSEDLDYEKKFAYMNEAFARLCTTDDAKEGVAAFFEKRKPVWQEK
ncbi:MAG: enoyl-CoA hydratase/isomerase family protein [Desulfarculaceae bacterium]|nr:enoyl-CoA hydratase/isomerase family protein [Desulfarculaceae bacterium]MCF8073051.1 enoyl-CoA hydratase/isomerase family protein [Desulfarculaceae bacterium]MCF8101864.1 enoyl-CoA hydratase/isomerase family protein [Desulfarculaceae bacterium]MCF8115391.1 enoyl-CoA hydratase/isomerase family protein [Desulfarculaceae bacterium]